MECSEPGTIRDEELVAYLDGEQVRPVVVAHLAHCQRCTAQLANYRKIERKIVGKLYRWDCPSNLVLGEFQLDLLSADLMTEVRHHLSACVLCSAEVLTLSEFLANDPLLVERAPVASSRVSVQPPAFNHHQVLADAKRAAEQMRDQALVGARRIIATLLPPVPRLAYEQRGVSAPSPAWPRRYAAEDVSISLQVEPGPHQRGSLQLLGFVSRRGVALAVLQGTLVQLSTHVVGATQPDAAAPVQLQRIDELGNFVFSPLTPATYTLELQFPEGVVVIDQLPVAAQPGS